MATKPQPPAPADREPTSTEVALIQDAALLQEFAHMAMAIPTQEGNATEEILRTILSAKTWDQLDDPWDTADIEDVVNRPMRLVSVKKMPSRYAGGLGVFLVLTLVDPKTGEKKVKSTGSLSVVAQVVRAYFLGTTAMTIVWRQSEPSLQTGFRAEHLDIIDGHTPERPPNG